MRCVHACVRVYVCVYALVDGAISVEACARRFLPLWHIVNLQIIGRVMLVLDSIKICKIGVLVGALQAQVLHTHIYLWVCVGVSARCAKTGKLFW